MTAIIFSAIVLLTGEPVKFCDIDPEMRARMGLPAGECLPLAKKPATVTAAINWCCGYDGSPCVHVTFISDCDPALEFPVACDWGQSNIDGTITCYG